MLGFGGGPSPVFPRRLAKKATFSRSWGVGRGGSKSGGDLQFQTLTETRTSAMKWFVRFAEKGRHANPD